ncbi:TetR/AcrR family transcriptional regulator [Cellulosimicrobium cellulans]|uniref:TetR/AcrR family transcriptional regulator n=1 Tax=Cellulosimicrobium cellulans TaxID=1710 RepID=UPI0008495BBB|nr:TetR/AcrR family transcriptional regulator [Cellulosimicrobium cellulans]
MGQRELLLQGARTCLVERGYAHTTARDIVAAGGANLASIGYHFGSKEALLNAVAIELVEEWGDRLAGAVDAVGGATPAERLEQFVGGLLSADEGERRLLAATVQVYAQAEFAPEVRRQLQQTYDRGRLDVAALILDRPRNQITPDVALTVGSLALAIVNGAVMQWLVDPETAPGVGRVATALAALAPASAPGRR